MTLKRIHIDKNVKLCEKLVLYFYENVQKIAAFAMLFWFSVTKQSLKLILAPPNYQKYPRYPLVLKCNGHISTAAAFDNSVFLKMEILVRCSALVSS